MSVLWKEWDAVCYLREQADMAIIGLAWQREPMPIEMLFAELYRHMPSYLPSAGGPPPPMPDSPHKK